jgi:ABC-type multidrug transport system permease subunit
MVIWTLAKKDLRLLLRDARAMIILLAMPLIFILVLGVSLGEGFGQKAEDRLRVSVLVLDEGLPRHFDRPAMIREGVAWFALQPGLAAGPPQALGSYGLALASHNAWFPHESWAALVLRDLSETADIKIELIDSRERAEELKRTGRRAAVLVLGPHFSKRVERCSFLAAGWRDSFTVAAVSTRVGDPVCLALAGLLQENQSALPLYLFDGLNPFYRDGVRLDVLDVEVLRDPTQQTASAIIDQVVQGSMLRVVMPWMIGRAFEKIGDPAFLALLGHEEHLPGMVKTFLTSPFIPAQQKRQLSTGLQNSLQNLFSKYDLTAKTWAALTKEAEHAGAGRGLTAYREEGTGVLKRGAIRYQLLVPSYLVMFAFFLVLTVGWLFVAERRQGTMKRLVAAPLSRWQILTGKLLPCLILSLFQGFFLLAAGRVLFGMSWGPAPAWLVPVVVATSLAAMGLAMLVAALARTESQVAIYGTLLVLVLAGLSGAMMGDRSLMPEQMQQLSRITPHAWALDAYKQLLISPTPDLGLVALACAVLAAFGALFLALAWWFLKLET